MKNYDIRRLAVTALFAALTVVLGNITQIPLDGRQFNLGFLPAAAAAYLLGIPAAVAAAAIGDVIGALLFPTGAFFPGFTLTAALAALAYGLLLSGQKRSWPRVAAAMLLGAAVNLFINSIWLSVLYSGKGYWAWVAVRAPSYLPELPLQIVLTGLVLKAIDRIPLPDWLRRE